MGIFDFLGIGKKRKELELAIQNDAVIVDVRSKSEFNHGHSKDAINIPLEELEGQVSKLKKLNKPLILVCASGMRSGRGVGILKKNGLDALNGISWKRF